MEIDVDMLIVGMFVSLLRWRMLSIVQLVVILLRDNDLVTTPTKYYCPNINIFKYIITLF